MTGLTDIEEEEAPPGAQRARIAWGWRDDDINVGR
jgi:hypothetical protein